MRTRRILQGLFTSSPPRRPVRTRIGLWWTSTFVAAVRSTGGETTPVMFAAWPMLTIAPGTSDAEVWRTVAAAAGITPDETSEVIAVVPTDWGPAQRSRWHRAAADAGVTMLRTVPAPEVSLSLTGDSDAVNLVVTCLSDNDFHLAAISHTDGDSRILAQHRHQRSPDGTTLDRELATWITALLADADTPGQPARITLIGEPRATGHLASFLDTDAPVRQVSPVALAEEAVTLATARTRAAAPVPPSVPAAGVLSTGAAALLCLVLAGSIIADTELGYDANGPIVIFSPGHLAVAAVGLAVSATAVAMLLVHWRLARDKAWNWSIAGTWLAYGAAAGLVAAGVTGMLLASSEYVQARGPLMWTVLPTVAITAAYAATGFAIHRRPDTPPTRRIWPPMPAIAVAAVGVLVIRFAEPLFAQMPTSSAFIARIGLILLAVATGLALVDTRVITVVVAVLLALAYILTVSAGTGTVACVLFIAAVTVRAAVTLAGVLHGQHISPRPDTGTLNRPPPKLAADH